MAKKKDRTVPDWYTGPGAPDSGIPDGSITLAKLAHIASQRILGRITAATGVVEALTVTQVTSMLNVFTSALKGLVPSGGSASTILRGDATWAPIVHGSLLFGSGYDSNATLDGVSDAVGFTRSGTTYTTNSIRAWNTLTINGGVTLVPNHPILARTLAGSGTINKDGASATSRTGAAGFTAGALPGSTTGGNGGIGVATPPTAGATSTKAPGYFASGAIAGVTSGVPATGGIGQGSAGGRATLAGGPGGSLTQGIDSGDFPVMGWYTARSLSSNQFTGAGGGGGGRGDTNSNALGGGGGAGGGWIMIAVGNCTFTGTVTAKGGAGFTGVVAGGAESAGGGGGGGGGVIIMAIGDGTLPTRVLTGGSGGLGAGPNGGNGGDGGPGLDYSWQIS